MQWTEFKHVPILIGQVVMIASCLGALLLVGSNVRRSMTSTPPSAPAYTVHMWLLLLLTALFHCLSSASNSFIEHENLIIHASLQLSSLAAVIVTAGSWATSFRFAERSAVTLSLLGGMAVMRLMITAVPTTPRRPDRVVEDSVGDSAGPSGVLRLLGLHHLIFLVLMAGVVSTAVSLDRGRLGHYRGTWASTIMFLLVNAVIFVNSSVRETDSSPSASSSNYYHIHSVRAVLVAVVVMLLFNALKKRFVQSVLFTVSLVGIYCRRQDYLALLVSVLVGLNTISSLHHGPHHHHHTGHAAEALMGLYLSQWARFSFFITSHQMRFDALQLFVAFIGFDRFSVYYGGFALFVNTFGSELVALAMALLYLQSLHKSTSKMSFLGVMLVYRMMLLVVTCVSAYILRRHLMLWAVFAPKLVFEVCMWLVVGTAIAVMDAVCL